MSATLSSSTLITNQSALNFPLEFTYAVVIRSSASQESSSLMYTINPSVLPVSKARVPEKVNRSPTCALLGMGSNAIPACCF